MKTRSLFLWLARIAVAGVFIAAAVPKILDPAAFALATYRYRILPGAGVNAVAILLPWLELTTGVALLVGRARLRAAAAWLLVAMTTVFTIAISLNLVRGIETSCGCFSTRADAAVSDGWNLLRNAALIWLGLAAWLDAMRSAFPPPPREPT